MTTNNLTVFQLAEKATPRPWRIVPNRIHTDIKGAHSIVAHIRYVGRPDGTSSKDDAALIVAAVNALAPLAELVRKVKELQREIQSMCFYWPQRHRSGDCKEMNGHYCAFCTLSDKLAAALKEAGVE